MEIFFVFTKFNSLSIGIHINIAVKKKVKEHAFLDSFKKFFYLSH